MPIIISKNGKNAVKVDKSAFEKENYLQKYIYDNPESIPLYDIKEDVRLLILAREFPTNSGPIDAVGVDKDGEIYVVETKLYKNPDKRIVISQALDYGAALWKHSGDFNDFLSTLDEHTQKVFKLRATEKIKDFFSLSDEEIPTLVDKMRANLNGGVFHFVVMMDRLDDRLRDLILYVNQNSQFDIYAVELEYYKHETYEIVIPKIFGAEVKKDIAVTGKGKTSERKIWTEDELLQFAKQELPSDKYIGFEKLFDFSKKYADTVNLGTGSTRGSFGPVFEKLCPRTIFTLRTNGVLSLNFQWLDRPKEADTFRKNYFTKMKEISFDLSEDDINKYPSYSAEDWLPKVDSFTKAIEGLINKLRKI